MSLVVSSREAEKYLRKPDQVEKMTSCDETDSFMKRARSLLIVVSTPPTENYEDFTAKVREYNTKEPFNFSLPILFHNNNFFKVSQVSGVLIV